MKLRPRVFRLNRCPLNRLRAVLVLRGAGLPGRGGGWGGSERPNPWLLFLQEALRNGLVATEVLMWFYIGEIIGKGGLIGYNV